MANEYWADRMARSQKKITNKSIRQIEKQLAKYYASAMKHAISDFEATYDKLLATIGEGREPTPADLYKLDKYWQMQGQLRQELQKLGNKQIAALSKVFELNFFEIYYSFGIPGQKMFSTISTEAAQQLINSIWVADGKTFSQRVWGNVERLIETLNEGLLDCVITGKKTSELKKTLQERFGVSYRRADMLARTELAHIQTEAAKKRYEDYGISQVQFWADPDERRCEECGKLHKKVYPVGAAVPLPLHPNCRCVLLPIVENNLDKTD